MNLFRHTHRRAWVIAAAGLVGCQVVTGIHERELDTDDASSSGAAGNPSQGGSNAAGDAGGLPVADSSLGGSVGGASVGGASVGGASGGAGSAPTDAHDETADAAPINPSDPHVGSVTFSQVSAAANRTCGIKAVDGSIVCWGEPNANPLPGPFTQVAAGGAHTCGLTKNDGPITCWGSNVYGQATPPVANFASVTAGDLHTCGRQVDGLVACWGNKPPKPLSNYAAVSAGGDRTCVLGFDGVINCWGSTAAVQVNPQGFFSQVSAGQLQSCGVRKTSGAVSCWQSNGAELFTSSTGGFVLVSTGTSHACAVHGDGHLTCWGSNGSTEATPSGTFQQVSLGYAHACALSTVNTITCWGDNSKGQAISP